MSKIADIYFVVDPWIIEEKGFNDDYAEVSESVFSLGNEYMGIRGYFEEGFSENRLQGSYINGIYERRNLEKSSYKSMLSITEFMVNSVDWLFMEVRCNNQKLDLKKVDFFDFRRVLDLRTRVLFREFKWKVDEETIVVLEFERFLSMEMTSFGGQKFKIQVIKGNALIEITTGLDFSNNQRILNENFWNCGEFIHESTLVSMKGITKNTGQQIIVTSQLSHASISEETEIFESLKIRSQIKTSGDWEILKEQKESD
jgi:maltose phosphorylase